MARLGGLVTGALWAVLVVCLAAVVVQFVSVQGKEREAFELRNRNKEGSATYPLVVLYHGFADGATFEWNTGVWPAWGEHKGDLWKRNIPQKLKWQAEGVYINKGCNVHCLISHDQSLLSRADAVVMELVNHYKFYGEETTLPIPWPELKPNQLLGLFQYEAASSYPAVMEALPRFNFTVMPQETSDVPVTLMCDWGYPHQRFQLAPPAKVLPKRADGTKVMFADFQGTIAPGYDEFAAQLRERLTIDIFQGPHANQAPPQPYELGKRINHMGAYQFVFITESIFEDNWICPELSQALLSGAVPVYLGAPNVEKFLPHKDAIVNVRDFKSADELADFLLQFDQWPKFSEKFYTWKKQPLPEAFLDTLDRCVHKAECRICKQVLQLNR